VFDDFCVGVVVSCVSKLCVVSCWELFDFDFDLLLNLFVSININRHPTTMTEQPTHHNRKKKTSLFTKSSP
jgi:hypothetical protein